MRGWAAVAGLAGLAAAVTALLMWWRWRQSGAALWVSPVSRHHQRNPYPSSWFWLLTGLGTGLNGWNLAVHHPTGGNHIAGMVALVVATVAVTLGVGGLLIERPWHRH
jgi:hypothetical protein